MPLATEVVVMVIPPVVPTVLTTMLNACDTRDPPVSLTAMVNP